MNARLIGRLCLVLALAGLLPLAGTRIADAAPGGPQIEVGSPELVDGTVRVPVVAAGSGFDAYRGVSIHLRWDPAVFRFLSANAERAVFEPDTAKIDAGIDPAPGTGFCVYPTGWQGGVDADGGGATFGCVLLGSHAGTKTGLLATFELKAVAPGCSALHLLTYGPPDGADSTFGTFTISEQIEVQANVYVDGAANERGEACQAGVARTSTPGSSPTPIATPSVVASATTTPTPLASPSPAATVAAVTTATTTTIPTTVPSAVPTPVAGPGSVEHGGGGGGVAEASTSQAGGIAGLAAATAVGLLAAMARAQIAGRRRSARR